MTTPSTAFHEGSKVTKITKDSLYNLFFVRFVIFVPS